MARGDQDTVLPPRAAAPQLAMTWAIVIEIGVLGVVLLLLARHYVWAGLLAILIIGLAIPFKGHSAIGWLRRWVGYARRSPSTKIPPELPSDLVPLAECPLNGMA